MIKKTVRPRKKPHLKVFLALTLLLTAAFTFSTGAEAGPFPVIARGGAAISGKISTNSKEALDLRGVSGIDTNMITPEAFAEKAKVQGGCAREAAEERSIVIGYREAIKGSFNPVIRGRIDINGGPTRTQGCGDLTGVTLSYQVYDSEGKSTGLTNKKFPLYKNADGVSAIYEIPLRGHILRSLPSGTVRIIFELTGKDDRSPGYKYPEDFKTEQLKITLSRTAGILLKIRLLSKGLATIALFIIALSFFIATTRLRRKVAASKKDRETRASYYRSLSIAIPMAFALSMEFYWGPIVNGSPLHGSILSSLLIIPAYLLLFRFIKKTVPFLILATLSITATLLYYISFDIYFSFFTDYPSVAMLEHSGQATSVLDSIIALTNEDHMTSLALALIYILILMWNAKGQGENRSWTETRCRSDQNR